MKPEVIKFTTPDGLELEGVCLLVDNLTDYEEMHDSEIIRVIYCQNRLIYHHYYGHFDWYEGEEITDKIEIEIISEYVVIPELDQLLNNK